MQDVLHWFPFSQQIVFQIAALVWCYLRDLAQAYLRERCCPTSGTRGCSSLCCMDRGYSLYLSPIFSQGRTMPSWWNSVSVVLRLLTRVHSSAFSSKQDHKKESIYQRRCEIFSHLPTGR